MIDTMNYLVLVNDWGKFNVEKCLQQGDPISTYLFIMVANVLGRAFLKVKERGEIIGIKPTTSLLVEVIKQFVDDTFLSRDSLVTKARAQKHVLEIYAMNASQKINIDQRKVFFLNTEPNIKRRVLIVLVCNTTFLANTYLGLQPMVKEVSNQFWVFYF